MAHISRMQHWSLTPLICFGLALSGCSSGSAGTEYDEREDASEYPAEFDEDTAREDVVADLEGQTFQDVGDTSRCTSDCGGHDAGWQWAQDNGVTDSSECSGSGSFEDGCAAYVEELDSRVEEAGDEAEYEY